MPNEEAGSATREETAHQTAKAELSDIMSNPQNPHYQGWKRGDKATLDHVDRLYGRIPPGEPVPISDGVELHTEFPRPAPDPVAKLDTPDALPGETPEETENRREVVTALRQEWGGDYEANMALAQRTAADIFKGREGIIKQVAQAFPDDVTAIKLLVDLGRRMK